MATFYPHLLGHVEVPAHLPDDSARTSAAPRALAPGSGGDHEARTWAPLRSLLHRFATALAAAPARRLRPPAVGGSPR